MVKDELVLNTDSSAPIRQLLLLDKGMVHSLFQLRLARIPSFFPDLLTLWSLMRLTGHQDLVALVQAKYAMVIGAGLILLQSWLLRLELAWNRWLALLVAAGSTFLLARFSPLYAEAAGLLLTPVHHGGTIINTLLMLCLLFQRHGRGPILVLSLVGALSNPLFIATALAPLVVVLFLLRQRVLLDDRHAGLPTIGQVAAAGGLGWLGRRLFNLQCGFDFGFHPTSNLLQEYGDNPFFLAATLLASLLLLVSLLPRLVPPFRFTSPGTAPDGRRAAIGVFLSLAALSPFAYGWFLPDLPRRYLLSLILLSPLILCFLLAAVWPAAVVIRKEPAAAPGEGPGAAPGFHGLALVAALWIGFALLDGHWAPRLAQKNLLRRDLESREAVATLVGLGLKTGLSDYWGTDLATISGGALDVQPIDDNGEPDLWAHNRESFFSLPEGLRSSRAVADNLRHTRLKDYEFVYFPGHLDGAPSALRQESIARVYGQPSAKIGCDRADSGNCIYLYHDRSSMRTVLLNKLHRFRSLCKAGNIR